MILTEYLNQILVSKLTLILDNRDAVLLLEDINREEKKQHKRDFYKILDISKSVSSEEIKKSYRRLASKWHPDKNSETTEKREHAEKMFKDINEAYNVLYDPKKRNIYDNGGHPDDPNSAFHTQENFESFDDILKSYYRESKEETNKKSYINDKKNYNKNGKGYNSSHFNSKNK